MNYTMGLVYSRPLFQKAGLDPDKPPTTWDEVRDAAKKISALGNGVVGYADYSKNNQGGWHLTGWLYSQGGDIARKDGDKWVADFNNDEGQAGPAVPARHALDRQLHGRQAAPGSHGRAADDGLPASSACTWPPRTTSRSLVKQFNGKYEDYGIAGMPGGQGTLLGGEGYMLNPKASPEKIKAGLEWIQWKYLNPDRFEKHIQQYADGQAAGRPARRADPGRLARAAVRDQQLTLKAKYANVPAANYQSYVDTTSKIKGSIEPPQRAADLRRARQRHAGRADRPGREHRPAAVVRVGEGQQCPRPGQVACSPGPRRPRRGARRPVAAPGGTPPDPAHAQAQGEPHRVRLALRRARGASPCSPGTRSCAASC